MKIRDDSYKLTIWDLKEKKLTCQKVIEEAIEARDRECEEERIGEGQQSHSNLSSRLVQIEGPYI